MEDSDSDLLFEGEIPDLRVAKSVIRIHPDGVWDKVIGSRRIPILEREELRGRGKNRPRLRPRRLIQHPQVNLVKTRSVVEYAVARTDNGATMAQWLPGNANTGDEVRVVGTDN